MRKVLLAVAACGLGVAVIAHRKPHQGPPTAATPLMPTCEYEEPPAVEPIRLPSYRELVSMSERAPQAPTVAFPHMPRMPGPTPPAPPTDVVRPPMGPSPTSYRDPQVPKRIAELFHRIEESEGAALKDLSADELVSLLPWVSSEASPSWGDRGEEFLDEQHCCSELAHRGKRGRKLLTQLTRSPEFRARLAAECALCSLGDPAAIKTCVEILDSTRGSRALGGAICWFYGCNQPALGLALEGVAERETDTHRSAELFAIVAANAGEACVPWLAHLVQQAESPEMRLRALGALGTVRCAQTDEVLSAYIESPIFEERHCAIVSLVDHRDRRGAEALLRELRRADEEQWQQVSWQRALDDLLPSKEIDDYMQSVADDPSNPNSATARYWLSLTESIRRARSSPPQK